MAPCSPEIIAVPGDARRPLAFMSRALGMGFQLNLDASKTGPRSLRTPHYDCYDYPHDEPEHVDGLWDSESTADKQNHTLLDKDVLADFDLGQVLGSGTTGVVYAATARLSQGAFTQGQQVAVKIQGSRADDEQREFAREEYELMNRMEHHAIVSAFALYEGKVASTIVMELCTRSLYNYVFDHGALTETHTTLLARQLFEGVSYLHSKRIVHQDIKPQNLLLKNNAQVLKITDFNSAKQIGDWNSFMLSPRGTQQYYPPEVHLSHEWNELVDEWGCGLCIFYMMRGMLPFDVTCSETAAVLKCGRLPPFDWGDNPSAPSKMLRHLILQCLTVNMHDRPLVMELLLHPALIPLPSTATTVHGIESAGSSHSDISSPSGAEFRAPSPGGTDLDADFPTSLSSLRLDPQGDDGYRPHRRSKRVSVALPATSGRRGSCSGPLGIVHADDMDDRRAPSMADAWRERRNGAETLQRLANRRIERTMMERKDDDESPSFHENALAATVAMEDFFDSLQEMDKITRYFTTHAASHLE